MWRELSPYSKLEHGERALLDRQRERQPGALAAPRGLRAVLLVDQPGDPPGGRGLGSGDQPARMMPLGLADPLALARRRAGRRSRTASSEATSGGRTRGCRRGGRITRLMAVLGRGGFGGRREVRALRRRRRRAPTKADRPAASASTAARPRPGPSTRSWADGVAARWAWPRIVESTRRPPRRANASPMWTASPTASDMTAIAAPSCARSRNAGRARRGRRSARGPARVDPGGGGDRVRKEAVGRAERLQRNARPGSERPVTAAGRSRRPPADRRADPDRQGGAVEVAVDRRRNERHRHALRSARAPSAEPSPPIMTSGAEPERGERAAAAAAPPLEERRPAAGAEPGPGVACVGARRRAVIEGAPAGEPGEASADPDRPPPVRSTAHRPRQPPSSSPARPRRS